MEELASIIRQLEQQRDAIDKALMALRGISGAGAPAATKRRGRPKKAAKKASSISEEGRKRIAEAQKARWAAKKAAAAKGSKKASKSTND